MKLADFYSTTMPLETKGSTIVAVLSEPLNTTSRYAADCIKNVTPTCPKLALVCAKDLSSTARVRCLLESNVHE